MNRFGPSATIRFIRNHLLRKPDRWMHHVRGVVHVGANSGQERQHYAKYGLSVLWIEPIPDVFEQLQSNLKEYPRQRAVQALLADRDNQTVEFHVANNEGGSSSIFDLHQHKDIWPEVNYVRTLQMQTTTLNTLVQREGIDLKRHDALIMDTQGSELLVLRGAEPILRQFKFIKTEVPDFESYKQGCTIAQLGAFMQAHGFEEYDRELFATHPTAGSYYDITYRHID